MISWKIKELAEDRGIKTPGRLSRISQVSYATVHELWNTPETRVDTRMSVMQRLARALDVPIAELFEEGGRQPASGNIAPARA